MEIRQDFLITNNTIAGAAESQSPLPQWPLTGRRFRWLCALPHRRVIGTPLPLHRQPKSLRWCRAPTTRARQRSHVCKLLRYAKDPNVAVLPTLVAPFVSHGGFFLAAPAAGGRIRNDSSQKDEALNSRSKAISARI